MWNATSLICVRNCSQIINATSLSVANTSECSCLTNYYWNSSQTSCSPNLICGDGFLAGVEQCDDNNTLDGDGCNADCTLGNNNGCPALSPFINPITGNCTNACPSGYYINTSSYSCPACSTITSYCTQCDSNGTICTSCQTLYLYNNATAVCDYVPCNDIHCIICPVSMAIC